MSKITFQCSPVSDKLPPLEVYMKNFSRMVHSALLFTTPTLMAYPTSEIPRFIVQPASHQPIQIPDLRTLSYDEVLDLLTLIELDCFDERYSEDELDQINQFISLLAMEIELHQEKIANPSKFIPHWDELHPERQHALINKKWPAEIQCYTEQRDVLQSILNERIN